jgi:hypothetical protein
MNSCLKGKPCEYTLHFNLCDDMSQYRIGGRRVKRLTLIASLLGAFVDRYFVYTWLTMAGLLLFFALILLTVSDVGEQTQDH